MKCRQNIPFSNQTTSYFYTDSFIILILAPILMSVSNNRVQSSTPSSYQKLTLRLSPLVSSQNGIIRISAKGTPTTNSQNSDLNIINKTFRHQFNNQSLPSKTMLTNLGYSSHKDSNTGISGKLIRSEVAGSTRNWQAECGVLKQTLDYYKNRIVQLQNKHQLQGEEDKERKQSQIYRQRLQETQQRMNEENAYLRDCMTSLNYQLQQTKKQIIVLQNSLTNLQTLNKTLTDQIKEKTYKLIQTEQSYRNLVTKIQQQKSSGQLMNEKLEDLEHHIQKMELENIRLVREISELQKNEIHRKKQIENKVKKQKSIENDCVFRYKDSLNNKQKVSDSHQNNHSNDSKKDIDTDLKRSLHLTKSVSAFTSLCQRQSIKLNNSWIPKENEKNEICCPEIRKSYSTYFVKQTGCSKEFDLNEFQQKAQQFRLLKMYISLQRIQLPANISSIANFGDYFCESVNLLINERKQSEYSIEKYKRLIEISWQNQNLSNKTGPQQFITQLIEKCNLYQSSLYQKKHTIDALQQQLANLKRQFKCTPKIEKKLRFNYLDREDQLEKQKVIITKLEKDVQHLNKKLSQDSSLEKERNTNSINTSTNSVSCLEKNKSSRYLGCSSSKRELNAHSKLKNISGEEILKQMETKLKFYEGEVVPELEAKISQYKGILDTFQRQFSQKSHEELEQSQVSFVSNISNIQPGNSLKKRKNINFVSFDQSRDMKIKHSQVTRPDSSDSNISRHKKMRLDQLRQDVNQKVLAAVTLRLCEIAQKMNKTQNYAIILPDSIYLINYSEQYVGSLKIKILETPKQRQHEMRRYWAPESFHGTPFNELSIVWNLGVLLDQTIHGQMFFKTEDQISNSQIPYQCINMDKPFFKDLLESMLEKDSSKRINLKDIQMRILQQEETLFN